MRRTRKGETRGENVSERRKKRGEVLRERRENERNTAGGREMGWCGQTRGQGTGGLHSRDGEERSRATFAFYARDELAVGATRRSIDAATSDVALSLAPSLHPSFPSRRLCCVREGGIIEIARRRVQQTRKRDRGGTEAPPATDQRRPCACFLFPAEITSPPPPIPPPSESAVPTLFVPVILVRSQHEEGKRYVHFTIRLVLFRGFQRVVNSSTDCKKYR